MPAPELLLLISTLAAPIAQVRSPAGVPGRSLATLPLEVTIARPGDSVAADGALVVHWAIRNRGAAALPLAQWQLPLDPLDADLFEIERDGRPVPFRGTPPPQRLPEPHELVTLAPGASVSGRVALSPAYDLARAGDYSIRYRVEALAIVGSRFVRAPVRSPILRVRRGGDAGRTNR